MAANFGGFLERWKADWIDPALNYIEGAKPSGHSQLGDEDAKNLAKSLPLFFAPKKPDTVCI